MFSVATFGIYTRSRECSQRPLLAHTATPCRVEIAPPISSKAWCIRNVLDWIYVSYGLEVISYFADLMKALALPVLLH